jgi:hypothetical protein
MKKIITALTVLLTIGSANAFGGFNNNSWDKPWGNNNQYQNDNGFFGFNSFSFFDPRWYSQEFTNMVNEIDDDRPQAYKVKNVKDFPINDLLTINK